MLEARSRSFTIGTVLATSQNNDLSSLGALLHGSAYRKLIKVSTCSEATQAMRRQRVPIMMLCDVKLEDQSRGKRRCASFAWLRANAVSFFCQMSLIQISPVGIAEHSGLELLVRPWSADWCFIHYSSHTAGGFPGWCIHKATSAGMSRRAVPLVRSR